MQDNDWYKQLQIKITAEDDTNDLIDEPEEESKEICVETDIIVWFELEDVFYMK